MLAALFTSVSLVPAHELRIIEDGENNIDQLNFLKVFNRFSRTKDNIQPFSKRRNDPIRNEKIRNIYNLIKRAGGYNDLKEILKQKARTKDEENIKHEEEVEADENVALTKDEMDKIVEKELQHALALKSSALLDKPFVQKRGRNDFLVLRPEVVDPFVTVIPNDIYYMKEKSCVNWLADCNSEGIRARLLQKVMYP